MLIGDSNGRPVAVPVVLILALVERVQRMGSSVLKTNGPQVSERKEWGGGVKGGTALALAFIDFDVGIGVVGIGVDTR